MRASERGCMSAWMSDRVRASVRACVDVRAWMSVCERGCLWLCVHACVDGCRETACVRYL